jgi:hypothetical protein
MIKSFSLLVILIVLSVVGKENENDQENENDFASGVAFIRLRP